LDNSSIGNISFDSNAIKANENELSIALGQKHDNVEEVCLCSLSLEVLGVIKD
jgi:hypothetical protein